MSLIHIAPCDSTIRTKYGAACIEELRNIKEFLNVCNSRIYQIRETIIHIPITANFNSLHIYLNNIVTALLDMMTGEETRLQSLLPCIDSKIRTREFVLFNQDDGMLNTTIEQAIAPCGSAIRMKYGTECTEELRFIKNAFTVYNSLLDHILTTITRRPQTDNIVTKSIYSNINNKIIELQIMMRTEEARILSLLPCIRSRNPTSARDRPPPAANVRNNTLRRGLQRIRSMIPSLNFRQQARGRSKKTKRPYRN